MKQHYINAIKKTISNNQQLCEMFQPYVTLSVDKTLYEVYLEQIKLFMIYMSINSNNVINQNNIASINEILDENLSKQECNSIINDSSLDELFEDFVPAYLKILVSVVNQMDDLDDSMCYKVVLLYQAIGEAFAFSENQFDSYQIDKLVKYLKQLQNYIFNNVDKNKRSVPNEIKLNVELVVKNEKVDDEDTEMIDDDLLFEINEFEKN